MTDIRWAEGAVTKAANSWQPIDRTSLRMSEREALLRFHDWRATRGRNAATHRRWRHRCTVLITAPVSIGLAALVLAAGAVILMRYSPYAATGRKRGRSVSKGPGSIDAHR
jgi:hypothetical protein